MSTRSVFGLILLIVFAFFSAALPDFCLGADTEAAAAGGFAPPSPPAPQIAVPQIGEIPPAPQPAVPPKPEAVGNPLPDFKPDFTPPAPKPAEISVGNPPVGNSAGNIPSINLPVNLSAIPAPATLPDKMPDKFNTVKPTVNPAVKPAVKPNINAAVNPPATRPNELRRSEIVPAVADMEPSPELLRNQPELLRSVADVQHPFHSFYEIPKQPGTLITGKPISVAQLFAGVSSPAVRSRLLQKYWELAGLLVEYNVRLDAEMQCQKWLSDSAGDVQRQNVFSLTLNQIQQQRKSAELTFIMTQRHFAEMLKPYRQNITEKDNLPLPADFPIYKRYETYSEKIARSERAVLLGHLIPIQEQLLNSKMAESVAAHAMIQNTMQQLPQNPRDLIFTLNQRTEAFCGLITAAIDYNKMIAEYVSETVGSGVSQYRLVSAVIELPKWKQSALK